MKKSFFISIIFLFACAHNPFPLKQYVPELHAEELDEWGPHKKAIEWWYVTGILGDGNENNFFYQFTIFHQEQSSAFEGFALHLALTDMRTGKHYFFEKAAFPGPKVYANDKEIRFGESFIEVSSDNGRIDGINIKGVNKKFSFDLDADLIKPPVWHGADGIVSMGHPGDKSQSSFYYSFTSLETNGQLIVDGNIYDVQGDSWFDRQWGLFKEYYWDWLSLRLDDGRDIMFFCFPGSGYMAGTMIGPEGNTEELSIIGYERLANSKAGDGIHSYPLGWELILPGPEKLTILPLYDAQSNRTFFTPSYWEGVCKVFSAPGDEIGWCVVETTAGPE